MLDWCHCLINSLWPSDAIKWKRTVNIGSGNGLLPDGTKPLPDPMLTYHQYGPVASIGGHYHEKVWRYQSVKQFLKITFLESHSDLPGANELMLISGSWLSAKSGKWLGGVQWQAITRTSVDQFLNCYLALLLHGQNELKTVIVCITVFYLENCIVPIRSAQR